MSEMDEDVALAALLTALEDLHNIRNEMHACIKQGFLNMAKARRTMGRNSVSVLDTREHYAAEVTVSIDADCDSEGRLKASKSIFSRNRIEAATPPVVVRDGSLRQRGGVVAPVEIEESLLQPDQDAPVRGDSLSLFATLVPPPLRKSKKNFTSGVGGSERTTSGRASMTKSSAKYVSNATTRTTASSCKLQSGSGRGGRRK